MNEISKLLIDKLGLDENESDNHITKLNRVAALDFICSLGQKDCIEKTHNHLVSWLKNKPT